MISARRLGAVRIGVVGLGYWGPNLARNVVDCPHAELAWLCDSNEERLSAVSRRYPGARHSSDVAELFADPLLDALIIATPISTHYAIASAALEAGKHVWIEKPFAASSLEAETLVELALRKRLVLLPGHTFLYSPPVVKLKELIQSGELGDIYFVSMSRVNLGLHQSDASVVWDLGPHDFSILRYWLGEVPEEVSAMTRCCVFPDIPDVAFINARFASGAIAHLELSWLSPSKLRRTALVGSKKMAIYDDMSPEPVRLFDSGASIHDPETFGEYRLTYRTGDIVSPRIEATEPLAIEAADFCGAILEGREPRSSPAIGIDVIRSLEAVERSLSAGGHPSIVSDVPSQSRVA